MRTITVSQPSVMRSGLSLEEPGRPSGSFAFEGLLQRVAHLELGDRRVTFTTVGFLGRTIQVTDAEGAVGEFRLTGFRGRGEATVEGRRYQLRPRGLLTRRFHWSDADRTEVVRLRMGGAVRVKGTVEVADVVEPLDAAALVGLGLIAHHQAVAGNATGGMAGD